MSDFIYACAASALGFTAAGKIYNCLKAKPIKHDVAVWCTNGSKTHWNEITSFLLEYPEIKTWLWVAYHINEEGVLTRLPTGWPSWEITQIQIDIEMDKLSEIATSNGVSLIPMIHWGTWHNPKLPGVLKILKSPELQSRLIEDCISEAKLRGFAGFNLDFESFDPSFFDRLFRGEFSEEMGKLVNVTAESQGAFRKEMRMNMIQFLNEFSKRFYSEGLSLSWDFDDQSTEDPSSVKSYMCLSLADLCSIPHLSLFWMNTYWTSPGSQTPAFPGETFSQNLTNKLSKIKNIVGKSNFDASERFWFGFLCENSTQGREFCRNAWTIEMNEILQQFDGLFRGISIWQVSEGNFKEDEAQNRGISEIIRPPTNSFWFASIAAVLTFNLYSQTR